MFSGVGQSASQPVSQSVSQSVSQPASQPASQSVSQSMCSKMLRKHLVPKGSLYIDSNIAIAYPFETGGTVSPFLLASNVSMTELRDCTVL